MFVSHEERLEISFAAARARLANLAHGGSLISVSEACYGEGVTGLARVGPLGATPGVSRLVTVHISDWVTREDAAVLPLRWQAAGGNGRLFPALDADLTLTPAGEQLTLLRLDGVYRPPLGMLGERLDDVILHRVATATIRSFTSRVADAIVHPASVTGPALKGARPEPEIP